jgi:hypothetical protein
MAGFPQGPCGVNRAAQKRETSTRHIRKISVAFINIVAGKNCLVRQHRRISNFFRGPCIFFREKFDRRKAATAQAIAKYTAKHGDCAQPSARSTRSPVCSRKQRVKSIFTLPLQCNGQSVVWSRVADSVA